MMEGLDTIPTLPDELKRLMVKTPKKEQQFARLF
jgi:hypothetical protein